MVVTGETRHFFTLTSLQIGDLQSYLSHLTLFLAPESKKIFILVDNRPWLIEKNIRSAHLWQLMVTKSRLSPFANTRARRNRGGLSIVLDLSGANRTSSPSIRFRRWFQLIDATLRHNTTLLPVKKLKDWNAELLKTLYGFIVFGFDWADVRGVSYLNELQTDTSLALETKFMSRWEFDSIKHASDCLLSWFPGSYYDCRLLLEYLDDIIEEEFYDAKDSSFTNVTSDVEELDSNKEIFSFVSSPYKRRKVNKHDKCEFVPSVYEGYDESSCLMVSPHRKSSVEAIEYKDTLVLFKFSDRDLPFRLKEIIVSDLRLLTLLEAGLPSWVIFLQSYPVFCKFYRPWMCPLVRTVYVLMSITTVVIGFYDLYKNVPVLKTTAAHLFGPLFCWIENWEMISRIRYLGTMLFLHNFQRAIKWLMMITRCLKSFLSVMTRPMFGPFFEIMEFLLPLWETFVQVGENLVSVISVFMNSLENVVTNLGQIFIWPVWSIASLIWWIVTYLICPILLVFKDILLAPFHLIALSANILSSVFFGVLVFLKGIWIMGRGMLHVGSVSETAALSAYQSSVWSSIWSDLHAQVFRALRSILNGFIAFFAACNRHRLSIYNHIRDILEGFSKCYRSQRIVLCYAKEDESHSPDRYSPLFYHGSAQKCQ